GPPRGDFRAPRRDPDLRQVGGGVQDDPLKPELSSVGKKKTTASAERQGADHVRSADVDGRGLLFSGGQVPELNEAAGGQLRDRLGETGRGKALAGAGEQLERVVGPAPCGDERFQVGGYRRGIGDHLLFRGNARRYPLCDFPPLDADATVPSPTADSEA